MLQSLSNEWSGTWSNSLQKGLFLLLCTLFLQHHCQKTWMWLDTKFQTYIKLWIKLMLHTVKSRCHKNLLIVEVHTVLLIRQNSGTMVIRCIFYVQRAYSVTIHSYCQCNQHFTWAANFQNWVGCFCEVYAGWNISDW